MLKRLLILSFLYVLANPVVASSDLADVILVVDGSAISNASHQESLEAAIKATADGLDENSRFGVFEFDANSSQQSPLEPVSGGLRQKLLASLLLSSNRQESKLNPASALEKAIYRLRTEGRNEADRIIVMLSDGIMQAGDATRDNSLSKWLKDELSVEARQAGIRIYWLTLSESADYQLIQSVTQKTDGRYFRAFTPSAARSSIQSILTYTGTQTSVRSASADGAVSHAQPRVQDNDGDIQIALKDHAGIVIVGGAGLAIILMAVVFYSKRRKGAKAQEPKTGRRAEDKRVTLRDLSDFTAMAEYDITARRTYIGRLPREVTERSCVIVIRDSSVGRNHASIEYLDNAYWISDHGTVNGTYLNGMRLQDKQKLTSGDRIRFARFEFKINIPASMVVENRQRDQNKKSRDYAMDTITEHDDDRTVFRSRHH